MKKNWRKKKQAQQQKIRKLLKNHTNVGKQHKKHQLTQKCKTPPKTTGQSAETAAHNKRKAGTARQR